MLAIFKLFFPKLTKESCKTCPFHPLMRKPKTKDPFAKTCEREALVSCFSCQKANNCPLPPLCLLLFWLLSAGNHPGFTLGHQQGSGEEGFAVGREERKTAASLGSESETSIKVSILCECKGNCSATTHKDRVETANNKEADPR